MSSFLLSEMIITAKLFFQQVSLPNHLSVRNETGGTAGGRMAPNRWSVEKERETSQMCKARFLLSSEWWKEEGGMLCCTHMMQIRE